MINHLVRKNILNLKPYSSARDEFKGTRAVFLDANENPYGNLNRYPDPQQLELKQKLSQLKAVPAGQIFIGNGSDEVIDLALRIFCEPGKDKIMICPPTYGMYEVAADIHNVAVVKVPLTGDFQLNVPEILLQSERLNPKIIFICSPNNPTGNSLYDIEPVLQNFKGIVVIDEAYIDFSKRTSYLGRIKEYPRLIISQTFSKARGLAGARIGIAFSSEEIIRLYNRIKPPYNVSALNQKAAVKALDNRQDYEQQLSDILAQRDWLLKELGQLDLVQQIYPSDANFILISIPNATHIYQNLVDKKIIVRNRSAVVDNTLRITVGTPQENETLINELKNYEKSPVYR